MILTYLSMYHVPIERIPFWFGEYRVCGNQ